MSAIRTSKDGTVKRQLCSLVSPDTYAAIRRRTGEAPYPSMSEIVETAVVQYLGNPTILHQTFDTAQS